jgi:hypothetical protein
VRRIAREAYAERIPILTAIADGVVWVPVRERCPSCGYEAPDGPTADTLTAVERAPTPGDRVRAMAELSKVGMGQPISIDDVRDRLAQQAAVFRDMLGAEQAELLLDRLAEVWR